MKITVKLLNNVKNKKRLPVCIKISKDGKDAYISTGIYLNDKKNFVGKDGVFVDKNVTNANEINLELCTLLYMCYKECRDNSNVQKMSCNEIKEFLKNEPITISTEGFRLVSLLEKNNQKVHNVCCEVIY